MVEWMNATVDASLFVSAVTLGEIQAGIEITRDQDEAKAAQLEAWLELVAASYNVLPILALKPPSSRGSTVVFNSTA